MPAPKEIIDRLHARITPLLAEIQGLFENAKVTLIVRNPDLEDGVIRA